MLENTQINSRHPLGKITMRTIGDQLGRFLMSILAVIVGSAFLTGVLGLRDTLSSVADSVLNGAATYDLYIMGEESHTPAGVITYGGVSTDLLPLAENTSGVKDARALWVGPGLLFDDSGKLADTSGLPVFFSTTINGAKGPTWVEGHAPEAADQIALEESGAQRLGVTVGTRMQAAINGQLLDMDVVGLYAFDHDLAGAINVSLQPELAQDLLGQGAPAPMFGVNLINGAHEKEIVSDLESTLGSQVTVLTNAQYAQYLQDQADTMLGFVTTFLLVFVAIALFTSTFIIANTFQMSVRARLKEFALLRAVGASPKQVFRIVFWQALFIGLIGSAIGVLGGWGLTAIAEIAMENLGFRFSDGIPLSAKNVLITLCVGTVVTLVSAIIPARSAAKVAPVAAMRQVEGANTGSLKAPAIIGAVLLVVGAALVIAGTNPDANNGGTLLGVGAALVVLSVLALSAPAARAFTKGFAYVTYPKRTIPAKLAIKNINRNPGRTAITAGALIIGVTLVCAGGTLAASLKTSMASLTENQLLANLVVQNADQFSPVTQEALPVIEGTAGVSSIDAQVGSARVTYNDPDGASQTGTATFIDPAYLGTDINVPVSEGNLEGFGEGGSDVLMMRNSAQEQGFEVGDKVTFNTPDGPRERRIGALIDLNLITSTFLIPYDQSQLASTQVQSPSLVYVWVQPDADVQNVKQSLRDDLAPFKVLSVSDKDDITNTIGDTVDQVMAILYALLGLSIFVSALGIVNTLSMSVAERTREFGLLQAIGFGQRSVWAMVTLEAVLTSVFGAVIGVVTGVGLAAALQKYLENDGLSQLSVPWPLLILVIFAAIILGAVAAVVPALRAAKVPVLEAIATD